MLFDYLKIAEFRSQFPEVKYHYGKCPLWLTKPELILAPPDQNFNFKFNYMVACSLKYAIFRKKSSFKVFRVRISRVRTSGASMAPYKKNCPPTQTATQKLQREISLLDSQEIGSSLVSFQMIFVALQFEPSRFKFPFLISKIKKISELNRPIRPLKKF